MKLWLKKHFVPHNHNDHRPHFLHTKNTQRVLMLVLALELLVFVVPTLTFVGRVQNTNLASVLPSVLAVLTNDERKQNNLNELTVSPLLTEAAQLKAQDMADKSYFAHTSPDGRTPWYWLQKVGYKYDYAGENLAINFSDSQDVTDAWMNSATHRANIVKSTYTEIGTGVATGVYQGRRTVFVAQLYANPRAGAGRVTPPAPTTPPATALAKVDTVTKTETLATVENEQSDVLGAEVEVKPELVPVAIKPVASNQTVPTATSFEKISASPRHAGDVLFLVILGITVLALVLNVLIKINVQHPDLITNGLLVVAVIVAVLIVNNFIGTKNLVISQGVDYSVSEVSK